MSCILYARANYNAMCATPTLRAFLRENFKGKLPQHFADEIFVLNERAYCDRYNEESPQPNDFADLNVRLEKDFADFLAVENTTSPLTYARLYNLIGCILYQCSDADEFETLDAADALYSLRDWAARRMAESVVNRFAAND